MKQFTRIFIGGDVCGELGVTTLQKILPKVIKEENIDFCVVNGENAANGVGITAKEATLFFDSGVDVITGGNHTLEKFDIRYNFGEDNRILRPHNFPFALGSGVIQIEKKSILYTVINLEGRENMRAIDCPFQTADKILNNEYTELNLNFENSINILDFHAESTSEKEALAFYLDGRVSVVTGTHTHTQTADERILPKGTGYITDAGMIGARDSAIGGEASLVIERTKTQVPQKLLVQTEGPSLFCGLIADIEIDTKKVVKIKRIFKQEKF